MKKKLLVFVLGLTLTAGLLAGCGGKKEEADAEAGKKTADSKGDEASKDQASGQSAYGDVKAEGCLLYTSPSPRDCS